jgi:hypothetical protein
MKDFNFAVFILTHNRADNVITVKTLRNCGYTGRIILILDDTDKSIEKYKKNYEDCEIYIFNKHEAIKKTDSADNTGNPKAVVYARNMCHEIAKKLNIEFFLELDDDYGSFLFVQENKNDENLHRPSILNLDRIFGIFIEFLNSTTIKSIAFSQGGDFMGGQDSRYGQTSMITRKCMNSFFCKTDRPFRFYGLINEDVNCYVLNGSRGELYFTSSDIQLNQTQTQKNGGGLTDIYLELGTYMKSFYSIIYHPSSVVIKEMGRDNKRLHHSINSDFTYPKILREYARGNDGTTIA